MFQCTVLIDTDERQAPHISGVKTGVTLREGTKFVSTEHRAADNNGLGMWVKTPSGNWTAASYPNTVGGVKVYVRVQEIDPEPPLPETDVAVTVDTKLATVTIHSDMDMAVYFNGAKIR